MTVRAQTLLKHSYTGWVLVAAAGALLAALVTMLFPVPTFGPPSAAQSVHPASSPHRWAFNLGGIAAPDFTLQDQFGHRRSLSSYRGREVVLAFIDAQCTAVCPLTAEILQGAKLRLGSDRAKRVALVAVNANPLATSTRLTYRWSVQHHMLHQWSFLSGSPASLRTVYADYRIYDYVTPDKQIEHDAAVILIDPHGRERLYFSTVGTKAKPVVTIQEAAYAAGMARVLTL